MLIFLSTIPTVHALTVPPPKQKRNKSNTAHKHPIVQEPMRAPAHMLYSHMCQPNNSSNNATKHQPLKKHVPCNHHTPRTLISKTKDHAQNAAKDQSFTKNESLNPRRFAPRQISPRIRPKTTPKRMLKTHLFENHT